MQRQFWQHTQSGDIFAVGVDDSRRVVGACGPLHHEEVRLEFLDDMNYDQELADDINEHQGDYRWVETE